MLLTRRPTRNATQMLRPAMVGAITRVGAMTLQDAGATHRPDIPVARKRQIRSMTSPYPSDIPPLRPLL